MCTQCSVPHQRPLGLLNCLLPLVDQVRDLPSLVSQSHLLRLQVLLPEVLLVLPLVPQVCIPFLWANFFFLFFFFTFRRCYVNHNLCIPNAYDRIHRCCHVLSLKWVVLSPYLKVLWIYFFIHDYRECFVHGSYLNIEIYFSELYTVGLPGT